MSKMIYSISAAVILLALFVLFSAKQEWDKGHALELQVAATKQEIDLLAVESTYLDSIPETISIRYAADALSDFYTTMIEAGEVLGAGVRIEARGQAGGQTAAGAVNFVELKYGLKVAPAVVTAAAPLEGAAGLFSMLEEEVHNLPVGVKKVSANMYGSAITLKLEVDVFGR